MKGTEFRGSRGTQKEVKYHQPTRSILRLPGRSTTSIR